MSATGTGSKRKRVKIVQITVDGVEVDAKECTKCGEVKALTEYHTDSRKTYGVRYRCKRCVNKHGGSRTRVQVTLVKITIDGMQCLAKECGMCGKVRELSDYHIKKNGLGGRGSRCRRCVSKENRRHYEDNIERVRERNRKYNENNVERRCVYQRIHRKSNPEMYRAAHIRRRAVNQALPSNWIEENSTEILLLFDEECPLLTPHGDLHIDHVIPIAWGHGGSYLGNMIPLSSTLNQSKNVAHFYEWFETNRQRFKLDQSRFDSVVADLANQNGLTPDEYRQYVDWCFANKRSLDEIIADNKRYGYVVTSVELWRDSTGMQLPLLFDNREQTYEAEEAA